MRTYLRNRYPRVAGWVGNADLYELLAVLIVVGGIYGFLRLADDVSDGETLTFDQAIMKSLRRADDPRRPIGPPWVEEVGRDLTALGGFAVLTLMTTAVLVYLLIRRLYHASLLLFLATLGGMAINMALKGWVDRERPTVVPHLDSYIATSSFPSGHSMLSATVYLTLGALMARFVGQYRLKIYFISLALLLTGLVGFSRVFLGVHYPTDVLGGWTAGLVWALSCWLVARYLQRKGAVEPAVDDDADKDDAEAAEQVGAMTSRASNLPK